MLQGSTLGLAHTLLVRGGQPPHSSQPGNGLQSRILLRRCKVYRVRAAGSFLIQSRAVFNGASAGRSLRHPKAAGRARPHIAAVTAVPEKSGENNKKQPFPL